MSAQRDIRGDSPHVASLMRATTLLLSIRARAPAAVTVVGDAVVARDEHAGPHLNDARRAERGMLVDRRRPSRNPGAVAVILRQGRIDRYQGEDRCGDERPVGFHGFLRRASRSAVNPIIPGPIGAYTGGAGSPLNPLDRFGRSCLMAASATGPSWPACRHCMPEPMARARPLIWRLRGAPLSSAR